MSYNTLCNTHFSSQYAYLHNNQHIHVNYYIKDKNNSDYRILRCIKGHDLICAHGSIRKPHFRHKNSHDVGGCPMTEWHNEWQGNFPVTEIEFHKINENQFKGRRTDVLLNETTVIEFQHSLITEKEVVERTNDYNLHNKKIVWVIDGNKNISVKKLNCSKRVYIEFTSELWKYESFLSYDFIYLDINTEIYKIQPKLIKSNMIDVVESITKEHFIDCLLNNKDMFDNNLPLPLQCRLFIKQQGAGNGKTWGIIKMLDSDEFAHYKYFIYVSKQHSAVYVIYSEFQQQIKNGNLLNIELEGEPKLVNKKYIIKYRNKRTNTICQIIIGTVDSFMYAIGNKNNTEIDKFEGLVNSIIDEHIETTQNGSITYGGLQPKLYKETMLVGDEEQDLKINYAKAIIQIMRNRYIDVYIVGDKLQSISFETNAFTYLLDNDFSYIDKIVYDYTNICRRFNDPKLIKFVNSMIPFKKYDLPEIQQLHSSEINIDNPLTIFKGKEIFIKDTSEIKINNELERIMMYYEKEVKMYNRLPEDFLIVTPFTQSNPLVDALELAINIFWKNNDDNDHDNDNNDDYKRYAIFHKSEDGTSINLNESVNSTRIVSIHSSKGDGRKVVFVIGMNENGLCRFAGKSDSLIYDSLFHVAITRMKEKLYIRYTGNDDISSKIQKYLHENDEFDNSEIKPGVTIYNKIKYDNVKVGCQTKTNFQNLKEHIFDILNLNSSEINEQGDGEEKQIIDTSHHNVRFASILINLFLQIIKNEKNSTGEIKKQIYAIFIHISKIGITVTDTWKGYNLLLQDQSIPILKMSDKGRDYVEYYNIIIAYTKHIIDKINLCTKGKPMEEFCPIECMILYYMIECVNNGRYTKFHINELYNIVDIYKKSFDEKVNAKEHSTCLCNKYFIKSSCKIVKNTNNNNSLKSYICLHFEKMQIISNSYASFSNEYPDINWLINKTVYFNGKTTEYDLYKRYQLIGYDSNTVIIAYIKPQFNSLNYNQILMDAVFDSYLIKNVKQYNSLGECPNYTKFNNKKIVCLVFTTDLDQPYYINLYKDETDIIDQNNIKIQGMLKEYLITQYLIDCNTVYNFYKYWRKNAPQDVVKPLDIIDYIIQQLNCIKREDSTKQICNFITEFFNNIKFKIETSENRHYQKMVLKEYDNKTSFLSFLEQRITDSIDRYFSINCKQEETDDDDYDDTGFISE